MTDLTPQSNNFIIDILQNKYDEYQSKWDYDDRNDPNVLISPNKDIALEWTDYGLYRVTQTQSQLTLMDYWNGLEPGHTYTMYKVWGPDDWSMFQSVYVEGIMSESFRTDIPVNRFTTEFNGSLWEYTHIMRPGMGFGQTDVHYFDRERARLEIDVNNLIDQFYCLVQSMISVSTTGLIPPLNCCYALRDDQGFYFPKGFRGWPHAPSKIIQSSIASSRDWLASLGLGEQFINTWIATATSKWGTLL